MDLKKYYKEISCRSATEIFSGVRQMSERHFLLESKDISHIYGRLSLIGVDPVLEIRGKGNKYSIEILNERGEKYSKMSGIAKEGVIECDRSEIEEDKRSQRENIVQVIREFLSAIKMHQKEFLGLYGAFSYDFVRLFEEISDRLPMNEVDDFRLQLYDNFVYFDHIRGKAEIICYREDAEAGDQAVQEIFEHLGEGDVGSFAVEGAEFEYSEQEFMNMVENAREMARKGELFEVVFSNTLMAEFKGDPFALYERYSEINPSPYLFYFNFGNEQLVGASPEMMVRCEDGVVHMRPISGTARRGQDPVEDHEKMLELLSSEKERAELDMLIDLGRNDLSRICKPGVEISDYRFVEKYSKVMHTVAHVSGVLQEGYTALDALISCANAGTLTGAPKIAAMTAIEENEKRRRGYYGGAVGYLSFSGEMDTGIIIRTAHIKDGRLEFRAGATLLYDSDPKSEYEEVLNKSRAFLTAIEQ